MLISIFIATSAIPLLRSSWEQWHQKKQDSDRFVLAEIGSTSLEDLIARQSRKKGIERA
ncbi:MAG: hypothetical protein F6J93_22100 [Oscillatoria sp. SIO1A7]|nr:hypothetical protein [Oscillatoria sp. SIO1A7]